jgi:hypothetical protein
MDTHRELGGCMAAEAILRPAAVLPVMAAAKIVRVLDREDVANGGLWSASPGLWQRYDQEWNGPNGSRGDAQLAGSMAVIYDSPLRDQITIYKVVITDAGHARGLTVDSLCDEALRHAGLTLASCPRTSMTSPKPDPFVRPTRAGTG